MTDREDKALREFLKKDSVVIPDNGFTERVMRQIPKQNNFRLVTAMWTILCVALCLTIFFACGGFSLFPQTLAGIGVHFSLSSLSVETWGKVLFIVAGLYIFGMVEGVRYMKNCYYKWEQQTQF